MNHAENKPLTAAMSSGEILKYTGRSIIRAALNALKRPLDVS